MNIKNSYISSENINQNKLQNNSAAKSISFGLIPSLKTAIEIDLFEGYLSKHTQINPIFVHSFAKNSVDETTGRISPVAKKFLDFIYCDNSQFLNKIKQTTDLFFHNSSKNRELLRQKSEYKTILAILTALRNKKGGFEEKNLFYAKKLINMPIETDSMLAIPKFIEEVKDENGVVNRDKFKLASNILEETKSYLLSAKAACALNRFPKDKREEVHEKILQLKQTRVNYDDFYSNYPVLSEYCFDDKGEVIEDNYNFIIELTKDTGYYSDISPLVKVSEASEDNRKFILQMLSKMWYKTDIYSLTPIYKAYKQEDNTFPKDIKEKLLIMAEKGIDIYNFEALYEACFDFNKDSSEETFNSELFNKTLELMHIANVEANPDISLSVRLYTNIVQNRINPNNLSFRDRINLLSIISDVNRYIKYNKIKGYEHLDAMIEETEKSLNSEKKTISVGKTEKNEFINNVLAVRKDGLSDFDEVISSSAPKLEKMLSGLPLTYSRPKFLNKLTNICYRNPKAIDIIRQKTGIDPLIEKRNGVNYITGYNGIINLDELNKDDETEKQLYECMYDFMYNNEVSTGDRKLDKQLNYIIKAFPEFINTIGKKQNPIHKYTLDIHQLLVLAYSINNPKYKALPPVDKTMLKMAAIFHDLMKQENIIDEGHPHSSAVYAKSIASKIIKSPEQLDRLYELINNHHWLKELAVAENKDFKIQDLAFKYRRPNDFEIAKIITEADLKSVSEEFYKKYSPALAETNISKIEQNINYIYSTGNAIFGDYFLGRKALENKKVTKDGREYTVINLHQISDDEDMSNFGFHNGVKKKDLRFLVHMVGNAGLYNNLNVVKMLTSAINGGVLSESLISPQHSKTFSEREYGLILSQINTNIINASEENQGSGYQKDVDSVMSYIFRYSKQRKMFREKLLEFLNIQTNSVSDDDFCKFYKNEIASKKSLHEILDDKEIAIGTRKIKGIQLKDAINAYQDFLIADNGDKINEIIGYLPKIQGLIAKANDINDLDGEFLQFAYENNYPIVLV